MNQKGKEILFVADAHLGSGEDSRKREQELCLLLDSMKQRCCRVVLLGDMFDFWFTYRHLVPKGFVRLLGKLAELSDCGITVDFFIGNHDMWLFDYLDQECGIKMHSEVTEMEFGERRLLIGHGDGLGHVDRGFDAIRRVFRSRICQKLFALLPAGLTFPIAKKWSESNKRKHAMEDTLHYLGDDKEGIVIYCKEQLSHRHYDYCVFGHRHIAVIRDIGDGCTYVGVGDWLISRNYALFDPESGTMKLFDTRLGEVALTFG